MLICSKVANIIYYEYGYYLINKLLQNIQKELIKIFEISLYLKWI